MVVPQAVAVLGVYSPLAEQLLRRHAEIFADGMQADERLAKLGTCITKIREQLNCSREGKRRSQSASGNWKRSLACLDSDQGRESLQKVRSTASSDRACNSVLLKAPDIP